ncbi:hypothetical protein DPEC_G00112100 [Dallia pectoralis]|uniref:Uncharacterized protein n=1 Tax=Dallia pectoralis TaxID=75939 RepID=A0ACC2GTC9_DALPE|nr:hypothetical protein DPEC_G00112100 [Dallia pectoralis]
MTCCVLHHHIIDYEPNCLRRRPSVKVLEPHFHVETSALLLNIPPNKTLLRRHLATHFHLLVGSEAQHRKQWFLISSVI